MVGVSWEDAHRFCAWLSKKEGRMYRLPTDAEWSRVVSGERYPWGGEFPPPKAAGNYRSRMQIYDDLVPRTTPAGSFAANRFGLFDMGGNAWQLCEDEYKASMNSDAVIEKYPNLKKEKASDGTPYRVLRGASWFSLGRFFLRSEYRGSVPTAERGDDLGFRCVLVISGG